MMQPLAAHAWRRRGPLHPEIARIGQQIVDSAALSAREKRTVKLVG
jgi:hypothetical protein